jgi:O-antigen/teichoic acid export membrane protein
MGANQTPENHQGTLVRKGGLALLFKSGGMASQYLFTLVVARLCGPVELGQFTLSYTILQLLNILALLGLDNLLTRKLATAHADARDAEFRSAYFRILRIVLISSVCCALLAYATAGFLAQLVFHEARLEHAIRLMALALPPFSLITLHAAAYRGIKNMTGFGAYRSLIPLFNAVFLVALLHRTSEAISVAFILSSILVCIAYLLTWSRFLPNSDKQIAPSISTLDTVGESLPMMITGSVFFIMNWTDNLLIGILGSASDVAFYDTAFKLASVSALALMAVNAIQAPLFASAYHRKDMYRLSDLVHRSTRLLFFTTIPVAILTILFAKPLLGLFGEEFVQGIFALKILIAGNVVNALTGSVGILLQMTGQQQAYNRIVLLSSLLAVVLCLVLIPVYGIVGAAVASTAARIIQNLFSLHKAYTSLGILSIWLPGMSEPKPPQEPLS